MDKSKLARLAAQERQRAVNEARGRLRPFEAVGAENRRKANNVRMMIRGSKAAASKVKEIQAHIGLRERREVPADLLGEQHLEYLGSNLISLGQLPTESTKAAMYGFAQVCLDKIVIPAKNLETVTDCRIHFFGGDRDMQGLMLIHTMNLPKTPTGRNASNYLSLNTDIPDSSLARYSPNPIELEQIIEFNMELAYLSAQAFRGDTMPAQTETTQ